MKQVYLLLMLWLLVNYRLNIPGCHDVSAPVEPTNEQIVSQPKEKIAHGVYNIGQLIVPQNYEKIVLINDKLVKETTTTEGRKMDLLDIRKNMLKKQEKYMKLRTDDELSLLTKDDILQELSQINELAPDDFSKDNLFLLKKLKNVERTRHLMISMMVPLCQVTATFLWWYQ